MTRPSGSYPIVNRRIVGAVLLALGIAVAVPGIVIAGVELWHGVYHRHPPIWQNIAAAALFVAAGASLIQTGSVRETLGIVRAAIPLFQSQQPGGNRRTDPPLDDGSDDAIELPPPQPPRRQR